MKNFLLLMIATFALIYANAQVACVPGTLTAPAKGYLVPDSITGFKPACPGSYFEQIVYIKVPKDTTVVFSGLPLTARIDSFIINSTITGLPSYLTVTSVPGLKAAVPTNPKLNFPHLRIKGDSLACVKISGTVPANATPGTTPLSFGVRAYLYQTTLGIGLDTAIALNYYKFVIKALGTAGCAPVGIATTQPISQIVLHPNPAQSIVSIDFEANANESVEVKLVDVTGQIVASKSEAVHLGKNKIQIANPSSNPGYYFVILNTKNYSYSKSVYFNE